MDPRLKALIEVRELLISEGWAPDEVDDDIPAATPARKSFFETNPILVVISLATTATCFILLGAYRDLLGTRDATLSVRYVRPIHSAVNTDSGFDHVFVTIDGQWAWGDTGATKAASIDGGGEIAVQEVSLKSPTIAMDARNLVQLWDSRPDGAILIGQKVVSPNQGDASMFEVEIHSTNKPNVRFLVGLSVDQKSGRKVASSETRVKD